MVSIAFSPSLFRLFIFLFLQSVCVVLAELSGLLTNLWLSMMSCFTGFLIQFSISVASFLAAARERVAGHN